MPLAPMPLDVMPLDVMPIDALPIDALLGVAGFVTVAVITPGPNNTIVMTAATRGGFAAALPAIAGVVLGSLLLLTLIWLGAGALFEAEPRLRQVLMVAGAGYLAWLGWTLIRDAGQDDGRGSTATQPSSAIGLAAFQLLNPKAWILVLTAASTSAHASPDGGGFLLLAALFVILPTLCLALWAGAGVAIAQALRHPTMRRWFDRAMGVLLIASAGLLLL